MAPYLPASFIGPTWANRLVEFFALLQIMGCYQVGQRWHVQYRFTTCAGWPARGGLGQLCSALGPDATGAASSHFHTLHASLQIYVRPTLEAVELKMMDTSQASSLRLPRDLSASAAPA